MKNKSEFFQKEVYFLSPFYSPCTYPSQTFSSTFTFTSSCFALRRFFLSFFSFFIPESEFKEKHFGRKLSILQAKENFHFSWETHTVESPAFVFLEDEKSLSVLDGVSVQQEKRKIFSQSS